MCYGMFIIGKKKVKSITESISQFLYCRIYFPVFLTFGEKNMNDLKMISKWSENIKIYWSPHF